VTRRKAFPAIDDLRRVTVALHFGVHHTVREATIEKVGPRTSDGNFDQVRYDTIQAGRQCEAQQRLTQVAAVVCDEEMYEKDGDRDDKNDGPQGGSWNYVIRIRKTGLIQAFEA
jgi:hypothetical protein